jgi:hypothetical protein
MRKYFIQLIIIIFFFPQLKAQQTNYKWHPGLYQISTKAGKLFGADLYPEFRGVQVLYSWKDLEPEKGNYDFSMIKADLEVLYEQNKQLVIQLQYKSFREGENRVPAYITGPEYGGGVYETTRGAWDPVHWNPDVQNRICALLKALAAEFDNHPNLEALCLPESAPGMPKGFVKNPELGLDYNFNKALPAGFDRFSLKENTAAIKLYLATIKEAFKHTVVIQYINWNAVDELMNYANEKGVGIGGPDVMPRSEDTRKLAYPYYPKFSGAVPLGAAVQYPDYVVEGTEIPVREIYNFGRDYLKLNYMFWDLNRPPYDKQVLEMIRARDFPVGISGGLNPEIPSKLLLTTK